MDVVSGRSDRSLIDYRSIIDYRFSIFSNFNEIGVDLYIIGPSEFNGDSFKSVRSIIDRLSIIDFQYFHMSTIFMSIYT